MDEVLLRPVGGLDVPRLLAFLGAHAVPGVEVWDGTTYARAVRLPSGPAVLRLGARDGGVALAAVGAPADDPGLLVRVRHLTAVEDDGTAADDDLRRDDLIGPLVAARPALRVPGSVDHAETLVRTVVGQQVSLAGARATTGRLVALAGDRLPEDLTARDGAAPTHLFPTAAALAALDADTLPMPRSRGRCVVALGRALQDDPTLVADDDRLLALPGIGPWTVAYTRLRTRRDPDVLLASDVGVRRQVEALGEPADPRSVEELGRRWAPFRSTAMLHLWTQYLTERGAA